MLGNKIQKFTVRQQMLTNNYEIYRYRDSYPNNVALHHHDFYEVYLFLNGNVNYTIESRNYHLLPGDILLISPLELHQPRITLEKHPYERIVLWVNKKLSGAVQHAPLHHADALLRFHRARPHQSAASGAHAAPACDGPDGAPRGRDSTAPITARTLLPSAASSSFCGAEPAAANSASTTS